MTTPGDYHGEMPIPEPPTPEPSGWDLLDDYQLGKDVQGKDEESTRRFLRTAKSVDLPEPPRTAAEQRQTRTRSFWRLDGSAEQDAETMARILAGRQERQAEAESAIARSRRHTEPEDLDLDRIRRAQQAEIAQHLDLLRASQAAPPTDESPLQQALREAADMFLALGICPDHLEYIPDLGRFCSWGGKLYDHQSAFALSDGLGRRLYSFGDSQHGPNTACYSARERRWHLDRPVPPETQLTPMDRLLPAPRRHQDGSLRFSAQRPGCLMMGEARSTVYVVRNAVYTITHLQAAHVLAGGSSPLFERLAERAADLSDRTTEVARRTARTAEEASDSMGHRVIEAIGAATDGITSAIEKTTRLFRRR